MNEEKEIVELTESELLFILDVTRMARELYRIAHGYSAYLSVHDEVERKATAALLKIDIKSGRDTDIKTQMPHEEGGAK